MTLLNMIKCLSLVFHLICANSLFYPNNLPKEYPYHTTETAPFNPKIHTMGNVGFNGKIHASGATAFTKIIDITAYSGRNVRYEISQELAEKYKADTSILDIGCGVGTLTRELVSSGFTNVCGIDTSPEMLDYAQKIVPEADFICGNAGLELPKADLIISSFLMHEQPECAHIDILSTVHKSLPRKGKFVIVDICETYVPKPIMLQGEPYIEDYLENFETLVSNNEYFSVVSREEHVPKHVTIWTLQKK